jgi:transposase
MEKKLSVLGIALAQQVFHLVGMDAQGQVLGRTRLYGAQGMAFIAQRPPRRIGMAAGGGAPSWARRFREHGQAVQRMAPQCGTP